MKIILRLLMIVVFCITIYTIVFWDPKEYINYNLEEKTVATVNESLENNINIDNMKSRQNTKPILKVSEEVLKNRITEEDKNKVSTIINSMSEVDIDKIKKEENNKDREVGIENIFKLLNKRLSAKEFQIIKKIYDPYIDFTYI